MQPNGTQFYIEREVKVADGYEWRVVGVWETWEDACKRFNRLVGIFGDCTFYRLTVNQ